MEKSPEYDDYAAMHDLSKPQVKKDKDFPDFDPPDYYTATGKIPEAARYDDPPVEGINFPPVKNGGNSNQCLLYIDFLPKLLNQPSKFTLPEFDKFPSLMDNVNQWLRENLQYCVIRCESFERKVDKETGNVHLDETVWHQPKYGMNMFVTGLRLWLRFTEEKRSPQQLGYVNIVPRNRPHRMPVYAHTGVGMMTMSVRTGYYEIPDFEDLDKTLEKFNKTLEDSPLPGSVLTIETLDWKYSESWHENCLDPDKSAWLEQSLSWKLYVTFLRVFFEQGTPTAPQLGIKDFIPKVTNIPSRLGLPSYEPINNVYTKAQQWLLENHSKHLKVTNVQTIHAKVKERFHMKGLDSTGLAQDNGRTFQVLTNQTQFAEDTSTQFVQVLRIAYITASGHDVIASDDDITQPLHLSTRLFIPVRLSSRRAETTSQTVQRINAWIHAAGAAVIGADTLQFEFHPESAKMKTDNSSFIVQQNQGHYWMTAVRLYIKGHFEEPPPEALPPAPVYGSSEQQSECCNIL